MGVQLRPAEPADHNDVASVLIKSRAAFMPYAPSAHSEEDVRGWVRRVLLPTGGVTVAILNGEVVGVSAIANHDGCGWITQLYVLPPFVGQRIGSRLLERALAVLKPPIRLYTFQANVGARRFYERHGFRIIQLTDGKDNEERCPDVLFELQ